MRCAAPIDAFGRATKGVASRPGERVPVLERRKPKAKPSEAALLGREEHFKSILDTVPDAMVVIDTRGIIQSFSAAAEQMFGYQRGEAIGRNVSILMPSPHRENHDAYIASYLATGERRVIGKSRVVVGQHKDGTTFPIELALGEVKGDGDRLFTGFVRDISERQRPTISTRCTGL
jgi:two-component system sensor kinase FixL